MLCITVGLGVAELSLSVANSSVEVIEAYTGQLQP